MDYQYLHIEKQDSIAVIQLNHPPANTLSIDVCKELLNAFQELPQHFDVIVLTGSDTFFCAGANVKAFSLEDPEQNKAYFSHIYQLLQTVYNCPVPVIAAVNGVAMGAGMELSLCCDLRIVDEDLRMGATSTNMGLIFCTQRLPRLIGQSRAMGLLLTARIINGQEACSLGIAHEAAPAGQALPQALKLAETVASKPSFCLKGIKQAVHVGMDEPLEKALLHEREQLFAAFHTPSFQEQVTKFLTRKTRK